MRERLRTLWDERRPLVVGAALAAAALVAVLVVLVAPAGAPRLVAPRDDAGEELFAGLEVPGGARLAGPVHEVPRWADQPDGPVVREVVLTINRDPLGVWDRLVEQARAQGVALTGSASACTGYDTTHLREPTPAGQPDHPTLECASRAAAPTEETVDVRLQWGASAWYVLVSAAPSRPDDGPLPSPPGTEAAVPSQSRGHLPALDRGTTPTVGQVFGPLHACFADGGPRRFRVPVDARLLADARYLGDDSTAVLAADDPRAAIDDLGRQLAAHHPEGSEAPVPHLREVALSDGSRVWTLEYGSAGGTCRMWATADGGHVVVQTHSD